MLSPGTCPCTLPHRCLGRLAGSHALYMGLAAGRCRFSRSVARNKDRVCELLAEERAAAASHDPPRRTGDLAAPVLGAHDSRRSGLCGPHGLHTFQPSEALLRLTPGLVAVFVVPSMRGARPLIRIGGYSRTGMFSDNSARISSGASRASRGRRRGIGSSRGRRRSGSTPSRRPR
jgi:hypothetical protein